MHLNKILVNFWIPLYWKCSNSPPKLFLWLFFLNLTSLFLNFGVLFSDYFKRVLQVKWGFEGLILLIWSILGQLSIIRLLLCFKLFLQSNNFLLWWCENVYWLLIDSTLCFIIVLGELGRCWILRQVDHKRTLGLGIRLSSWAWWFLPLRREVLEWNSLRGEDFMIQFLQNISDFSRVVDLQVLFDCLSFQVRERCSVCRIVSGWGY